MYELVYAGKSIHEGFDECCLCFLGLLHSLEFKETRKGEHKETEAKIQGWINNAKEMKEGKDGFTLVELDTRTTT